MDKSFKHPLARKATIAKLRQRDGKEQDLLVIVTTLELESGAKGFNAKNVERLRHAAQAHVDAHETLAGYSILNRPKDWDA